MPYLKNKRTGETVWVDAPQGGAAIPANPLKVRGAQLDNDAKAAGIGNDAARLQLERERLAWQQQQDQKEAALKQQAADLDARKAEVSAPIRRDAIADFKSSMALLPKINELEGLFNKGPGATKGAWGLLDWLPNAINESTQNFDAKANQLRGFVKNTQGFTGGEGNTAAEAKMNIGAFIPSSSDLDSTTRGNISSLREEQAKGIATAVSTLGGVPDQNGNVTPVPQGYTIGQYPALDVEMAKQLGNVPPQNRQRYMLDALRRFEASPSQAKRRGMTGRRAPARNSGGNVIDFNDLP